MKASLLIASPQMRDPHFERAVVLVWHHDDDGAIGVVINKPAEHTLPDVVVPTESIDMTSYQEVFVGWGGPVETGSGTVITAGHISEDEGWPLDHGLAVTRSQDTLMRLLKEGAPVLLCLGYAGWGPGQLEEEIQAGGWLLGEAFADLLFELPAEDCYDKALAKLGLNTHIAWMSTVNE